MLIALQNWIFINFLLMDIAKWFELLSRNNAASNASNALRKKCAQILEKSSVVIKRAQKTISDARTLDKKGTSDRPE